MATKQELLNHCKWYKGEEKCPYGYAPFEEAWKNAFWGIERQYVNFGDSWLNDYKDLTLTKEYISANGKEYTEIPPFLFEALLAKIYKRFDYHSMEYAITAKRGVYDIIDNLYLSREVRK